MNYINSTIKNLIDKPLTKESALIICMEHWNKIAETLHNQDDSYLDFSQIDLILLAEDLKRNVLRQIGIKGYIVNHCACCEFNEQNYEKYYCMRNCLIKWNDKSSCLDNESEYMKYKINPTKENALKIAYLAEKALDELEI